MAKGMMMAVLVVELVIFILILGLASWCLDMYIDGRQNHPRKIFSLFLACSFKSDQ